MEIDDKKLKEILEKMPDGKSYCTQYYERVNPAIKLPRNIPSLEGIKKGNTVDLWAEKSGKYVIVVARINTDEFREVDKDDKS